jgi:hypothetical protein
MLVNYNLLKSPIMIWFISYSLDVFTIIIYKKINLILGLVINKIWLMKNTNKKCNFDTNGVTGNNYIIFDYNLILLF